jgi:formylglycine-generating enzyme
MADTACTLEFWQEIMNEDHIFVFRQTANDPRANASWCDIVERFIPQLSNLLPGILLRLPTEAEWEYCCRAGSTSPFYFGKNISPEQVSFGMRLAYSDSEIGKSRYRKKIAPVKHFPPNKWGLYQMHGNVWEWCFDGYQKYPDGFSIDPIGTGEEKVLRGGSWMDSASGCRSAVRYSMPDDGISIAEVPMGFRLAMTIP